MTTTAAGLVSTTVTAAALGPLAPLGFELEEPAESGGDTRTGQGPRIWVYVQNDAAAATAWIAGHVIARLASVPGPPVIPTTTHLGVLAPVDSNPVRILGVAQHAIPAGSFGFVLKRGIGEVLAGAETIDINEVVAVSAATVGAGMEGGAIAAAAHEAAVIGWGLEDSAAASTATCWINCPGG